MALRTSIAISLMVCFAASSAHAEEADPASDHVSIVLSSTVAIAPPETATGTMTLDALIRAAMRTNQQVDIAEAQVLQAKALYEFAAAQAFPRVTMEALFGGPTPEAKTTIRNDPQSVTPASLEADFNFGQLGVALRVGGTAVQPIYTFGKIEKGKEAASHVVKAAGHQKRTTKAELVVNLTRAFWTYQLTRIFNNSLEDGKKTLVKVLAKIEELLDNDSPQVTENDRLRLKYALATLAVRQTEAKQAQDTVVHAIRLLLGWKQDRELEIADAELDDLPEKVPSLFDATEDAQNQRPELLALREIVEAAETFAELRRRQFYPDIAIGGVLQFAYTSNATNQTNPFINDPFNFFNIAVGLVVRVELDIFHKLALLEQAEAEARVRASQTKFAEQAADFRVRQLHIEIVGGYERVRTLERANRTARGWLTASTLGYDIGTGAADELIDAFLAWAASEAELQKTRFDTMMRLTELARAAGRLIGERSAK